MLNDATATLPGLTPATWRVDPQSGHVEFRVRSMWGLTDVKGVFSTYRGSLTGPTGELVVDTASLDTGKPKRDKHLRSADFFDSQVNPETRFAVTDVRPGASDQLMVSGDLVVGAKRVRLELPVAVEPAGDGTVTVRASTSVPRQDLGLDWNWLGAIRGDARLDIELRLTGSS
jgi:polyisoprenoid-binding protein YceI